MTSDTERRSREVGREAAERYVDIDANAGDLERESALLEWLERSPDHEAAFERCEAAVTIAQELAARGELAALRAGAAPRAGEGAPATADRPPLLGNARARSAHGSRVGFARRFTLFAAWLGRPAVAWSVATAAVLWAVAASVERGAPLGSSGDAAPAAELTAGGPFGAPQAGDETPVSDDGSRSGAATSAATTPAATTPGVTTTAETTTAAGTTAETTTTAESKAETTTAADDLRIPPAPLVAWNPVAVLPGDIVVDVHSLAVLPFDYPPELPQSVPTFGDVDELAAAERIARQLHDEVMRQLARVPGLYVVDARASIANDGAGLAPDQIAALLSVRGVVAADVEVDDRTVRVQLRMTDAVNAGRRTETRFERPIDELPAVRTAIVANITDALTSTSF